MEDFQQGGFTLLDKLADYVRDCDLVIHLAGDACGARPTAEHVQALYRSLGDSRPDPLPDHSYTQWEYHLAQRFQRRVLVYLAAPEAPRDCSLPIQQSDDDTRLQQAHIAAIKASGKHYSVFAGHATLVREVFHDLGLEPRVKVNNLPYKSLGSLFKGRDEFLRQMYDALGRAEHRGHVRFAAITASATAATVHGLGGIGKTRAAIEFAHRYAEEYTALLHARADLPRAMQQNLAALCGPAVLDLPEQEAREIEVQVGAVLHWLQQHSGWLLILDNADSAEAAQAVTDLLGKLTPSGQVLVTSRLSNWPGAVESLPLDVLAEADATAFLLERTDDRRRKARDDPAQARTVALELGQLALALEQAGAYIVRHRYTFSQYLDEWLRQRDRVLEWFDERVMQYPKSVAVTWQTSFDRLTEPARELLHIRLAEAEPLYRRALAIVEHACGPDHPKLTIRLDNLASLLYSTNRLTEAEPLMRRALAIDEQSYGPDHPNVARDLNNLARLLQDTNLLAEAEPLMRRALAIDENSYGPDHPKVATRLNNLALLLHATNRIAEAEPLMRCALAIDEQSYGPTIPASPET